MTIQHAIWLYLRFTWHPNGTCHLCVSAKRQSDEARRKRSSGTDAGTTMPVSSASSPDVTAGSMATTLAHAQSRHCETEGGWHDECGFVILAVHDPRLLRGWLPPFVDLGEGLGSELVEAR